LARLAASAAVETASIGATAKNIDLRWEPPAQPIFVWGDAERLQQAITNLLSNAIKFTPERGNVTVSATRVSTHARIEVRDTGIGVAPEFLAKMFEPFAQADQTARRRFGGLGLGLSIVKHIALMHGGEVSAHSAGVNQGTSIFLDLPVPAVLEEPEAARTQWDPMTRSSLRGIRVMVVDDEPDARDAVQRILEFCGAEVSIANSASEALEQMSITTPDVLVADLAMPDVDGYELIRRIRGLPGGRYLPAAALTAFVGDAHAAALSAGFQHTQSKPVPPNELVRLVARLAAAGHRAKRPEGVR
jgi:CheY-like chemotaxis protein/anti-sigma regulatory factor (Ser/Thr protein kinase)